MLYQLPNGRTVELTLDQFLSMSEDELALFNGHNLGEEINDPFAYSVLRKLKFEDMSEEELEIFIEEGRHIEDLTDIDPEEKRSDNDFLDFDNIET